MADPYVVELAGDTGGYDGSGRAGKTGDEPDGTGGERRSTSDVRYGVDDIPPWYNCLLLGFQHYITYFVASLSIPFTLAPALCMGEDNVGKSELIGTLFFVSGILTLIQVTFGVRLAIIQGGTFALMSPTLSFLSLPQYACPELVCPGCNTSSNDSLITGSDEHRHLWRSRLCLIQGSIMVAALLEVILGFSGAVGFLLRFIGPLTIGPTVSLLGISLYRSAADYASKQWMVCVITVVLMVVFSQCLSVCSIPCPYYRPRSGCRRTKYPLFRLFPVALAVGVSWLLCYILTITNAFPNDPSGWGYGGRTDLRSDVLQDSPWFRFPYPGQWGKPTISLALVCGLFAGLLSSMVESVGDYGACARLSDAPPPPHHAINRGLGVEGLANIIAGAFGTGNGTTSTTISIGVVGITRCGSRIVVVYAAVFMIVFSLSTKFGALFVTIPDPIIGGSFVILFGMIFSVGVFNLQHVDMTSSRNLFIFGTSFFGPLTVSEWMKNNPGVIQTGSDVADSVLTVLLSTGMFLGGLLGFLLDNTVPGSKQERGIGPREEPGRTTEISRDWAIIQERTARCYDLPFGRECLSRSRIARKLPFCPSFGKTDGDGGQVDGLTVGTYTIKATDSGVTRL